MREVSAQGFEAFKVIGDADDLGDQSTGYTAHFSWDYNGETSTSHYRVQAVRVGTLVANTMFIAPEPPTASDARSLAGAQIRCLKGSACTEQLTTPSG